MIAFVVWLWMMTAQGAATQIGAPPNFERKCIDNRYRFNFLTGHCERDAPAEHVIEIRTKRRELHTNSQSCPKGFTMLYPPVPLGMKVTPMPPPTCERVTKELWIDGHKVGIIKETEE